MMHIKLDLADVEEFHIAGTPEILQCEISEIIGICYRKICNVDETEGLLFRKAMAHMMSEDSPVWAAPDLPGQTTTLKVPRKE